MAVPDTTISDLWAAYQRAVAAYKGDPSPATKAAAHMAWRVWSFAFLGLVR